MSIHGLQILRIHILVVKRSVNGKWEESRIWTLYFIKEGLMQIFQIGNQAKVETRFVSSETARQDGLVRKKALE